MPERPMLPQQHPREPIVQAARVEFSEAIATLEKKYLLTWGEMIAMIGEYLAHCAKYMIREERHGDPDKPGGVL